MTEACAAKMHSADPGAPKMTTAKMTTAEMPASEVTASEVTASAEVAATTKVATSAAEVAAASAAPSRSRVSCSSQNGREKNNGESFYPGHGTLERPPRVSNERGSVDHRITPGRCQSSSGRSRVHRNRPRTPTRFPKSNFRIREFES
jgi:hypothetical protein